MSMSAMPIMGDMGQAIGGSLGGNLPPNVGVGFGMPADGGQNPVADQTQQMANNPIYGQQSPFQPPSNSGQTQQNPNVGIGFGMPADGGMFGGKSGFGGMLPFFNNPQLPGGPGGQFPITNPLQGGPLNGPQLGGGPAGQPPITNQPRQQPQPNPQYGGGLRPAPRNYRPPMRSPQRGGNLRSIIGR